MFSVLVAVSLLFASLPACLASNHKTGLHHHAGSLRAATHHNYARAHSLGDSYQFDARDGWQTVNISNTAYANQSPHPTPSTPKTAEKKRDTGLTGAVEKVVNGVWEGLKALGGTTPVTITWYTGHDLLNPSCWSQAGWHPTDASFACALTEVGWTDHPKCLDFLELCNSPKKCVFVRVVDSCAGCAAGSKHVDLTRAAFGQLAAFSEGTLTVQLRAATKPSTWHQDLWGPKT